VRLTVKSKEMNSYTKEFLDNLSPEQAFHILEDGNKRFINNLKINRNLLQQMNDTAKGQYPFAAVLSCMDSRTSTELVFDQGLGDIFSLRIAGNIVNDDIVGSMEYACKVIGSKLIVVLGHTRCGAIQGACDKVEMGNLTGLLEKIKPAIEKSAETGRADANAFSQRVAQENVLHSMEEILERSSIIRSLFKQGMIGLVGGIYSVETGRVSFIKKMFSEQVQEKNSLAI
jgi:carbonic anhydrase